MKTFLIIILTLIWMQSFGQSGQLIIGKGYSASPDSTSIKVYISIQNDLDVIIENVKLIYDRQQILAIKKLKSGKKRCYSFLKKDLKGENIFILQYRTLADTLSGTDEISYNIHEVEVSGHQRP